MGNATVKILNGAPIAQMFIFKTSSNKSAYDGKYCHSQKPTISYQDKMKNELTLAIPTEKVWDIIVYQKKE